MANVFDTFEESDFAETERMAKWTLFGSVVALAAVFMVFFKR
jgi:hypothetical protein